MKKHADVDAYVAESRQWPDEVTELRRVLLDCGLTEEIKWGKPCYGDAGRNLAIMQEMKDFLALMFFKGALIDDADGVLREQGPNSRSARRIEFTSVDEVTRLSDTVRRYVEAAIDVESSGLELGPPPELVPVDELQDRLDRDSDFRAAFESLTAGRQREYNMYFSDAKQAATRRSRIERYTPKILDGKGFRDR